MNRQQILEYYSSDFVSEQLLAAGRSREVAGALWDGTYDQRPNILQYRSDVTQMAKKGVVSFHLSVEHWSNAMALAADNYDKLRTGWDVIIDIDSKLGLDESKHAAELVCRVLEKYGIRNYGIKFSGRRGFHISLPWIMFPKQVDYKRSEVMYPHVPRVVSAFIRDRIKDDLMSYLVRTKGAKNLMEMMGEVPEEFSPFFFVEVEKDWGNRHMFRAPFSLNEKAWLVSVPLTLSQMKSFDTKTAEPSYVVAHSNTYDFFFKGSEGEASDLLAEAMDWHAMQQKDEKKASKRIIVWERKITEENFPPCMKNILNGLSDGRKRSVFVLVNFLRMMNWPWNEIEQKIFEWNEKNKPPLPRNIILSQLRWSQRNERHPANCPPDGDLFYTDTRLCTPDSVCKAGTNKIMIKNPIVYPFRLMKKKRRMERVKRGYSCGVCGQEYKTMRALNTHKSRTHGYVSEME